MNASEIIAEHMRRQAAEQKAQEHIQDIRTKAQLAERNRIEELENSDADESND